MYQLAAAVPYYNSRNTASADTYHDVSCYTHVARRRRREECSRRGPSIRRTSAFPLRVVVGAARSRRNPREGRRPFATTRRREDTVYRIYWFRDRETASPRTRGHVAQSVRDAGAIIYFFSHIYYTCILYFFFACETAKRRSGQKGRAGRTRPTAPRAVESRTGAARSQCRLDVRTNIFNRKPLRVYVSYVVQVL